MGHKLVHAEDAGNGYHGRCEYCDLALVTDLGYNSWEGTTCIPIDREEEAKKQALLDEADRVYDLAYEYLRFKRNWSAPFTPEGWWKIRGYHEPLFKEVKKAVKKYKLDSLSDELIEHILYWPYNKDNMITIEKNKLILKIKEE